VKKNLFAIGVLVYLLVFGTKTAQAQSTQISLEAAIQNAAAELSSRVGRDTRVAVISMGAETTRMADYLIDNMIVVFQQLGEFTVFNRAQIDLLVYGAGFPTDQEMDAVQARALGAMFGANVLVTGTFETLPYLLLDYRLTVRTIDVMSGQVLDLYSANVESDNIIALLLGLLTENHFSGSQRLGTMFLNLLPGFGSFSMMDDIFGGTVQLVLAVSGFAMFIADIEALEAWRADDIIGGVLLIGAQVFNIVRSITYRRNVPVLLDIDPGLLNVSIAPGGNGFGRVSISHTLRF